MNAYRIEPATFEHLGWLRLLFARLVAEQPGEYPAFDAEELDNFTVTVAKNLRENPAFVIFVAIIGKRVVGFVGGELVARAIGKPRFFGIAHWLYVVPRHRKRGVARQLIAAGQGWLEAQRAEVVECFSLYGDSAWERRGFIPFMVKYYLPTAQLSPRANGHDLTEVNTHAS